jgi:hypothetical protein
MFTSLAEVPAAQAAHSVAAVDAWNLPVGHETQWLSESRSTVELPNVPAKQSVHWPLWHRLSSEPAGHSE